MSRERYYRENIPHARGGAAGLFVTAPRPGEMFRVRSVTARCVSSAPVFVDASGGAVRAVYVNGRTPRGGADAVAAELGFASLEQFERECLREFGPSFTKAHIARWGA